MKRKCLLFILLGSCISLSAQLLPIPLDTSRSLESEMAQKPVLESKRIGQVIKDWSHSGLGMMKKSTNDVIMSFPTFTGKRAQGSPDDPDYATFGSCSVFLNLHDSDLRAYNRISLDIFPECPGARVVNMNLVLDNESTTDLGAHLINLKNYTLNKISLEIADIPREKVRGIRFYTDLKGRDVTNGDSMIYHLSNLRLEKIGKTEKVSGWIPDTGFISYSTSGYLPGSAKFALVKWEDKYTTFSILDAKSHQIVYQGKVVEVESGIGKLDFSSLKDSGDYQIKWGEILTPSFSIKNDVLLHSQKLVLNYIFSQRCGYAVPGIHGRCHLDLFCDHDGRSVSYGGGWHDAGDLSQQTLQTGDVTYALLESYLKLIKEQPLWASSMLNEAKWGLNHLLNTRFGDGYRASSMGLLHWTDGQVGTYDDIHTVRKQNNAFDNYYYAAFEAFATSAIMNDPALVQKLKVVAQEDFAFAEEKFLKEGMDRFPHIMEHSYNTSYAQFQATRSWAASQLYKLFGEADYAKIAVDAMDELLACQESSNPSNPILTGYFYRDKTRQSIVHFIHQSRDQIFAQALTLLAQTQPHHPKKSVWDASISRYASYLKATVSYDKSYGMLPSGVYMEHEYQDKDGFERLHIFAPENAKDRYDSQIHKGITLDKTHYLRRFPIWFNIYNGNEAILLSTAKAVALLGNYLQDEQLLDIARDQVYWTLGRNPFCQSLIYGEGYRYPSMNSFSSGEIMGEMPVGIRSLGDDDIPYWPQVNNACYKEVWVTTAGKWLSLLSEL